VACIGAWVSPRKREEDGEKRENEIKKKRKKICGIYGEKEGRKGEKRKGKMESK
jgi:hypothetical protein